MRSRPNRRAAIAALALAPLVARAELAWSAALSRGGVVLAFRHANAPGTFDPPEFRLDDCRTQRNLDDAGRAQAERLGQWFRRQRLKAERVRSSPWCRCMDTARLAFGSAEAWDALSSPRGAEDNQRGERLGRLREALLAASRRPGRIEVWVTHMFVLQDLTGQGTASGEGLVLVADASGAPSVIGRIPPP